MGSGLSPNLLTSPLYTAMPIIDEHALNIFTDGSSYQHPRRGGMGILYVWVDALGNECSEPLDQGGVQQATNNRMELLAIARALQEAGPFLEKRRFSRILVHSDSQYVVKFYKSAMFYWSKSKYRNRWGRPISNAVEWQEFVRATQKVRMRVDIEWIRGKKHPYTKLVDKMSKASAMHPTDPPRSVATVRRKTSPESTDPGGIDMLGQRATIRIISSEYMEVQHTNKYRYEVFTKKSKYYLKVLFLYSKELMKPGHKYYVQFNRESKNPGVNTVFREIK
jgi:ribonuclease HI